MVKQATALYALVSSFAILIIGAYFTRAPESHPAMAWWTQRPPQAFGAGVRAPRKPEWADATGVSPWSASPFSLPNHSEGGYLCLHACSHGRRPGSGIIGKTDIF